MQILVMIVAAMLTIVISLHSMMNLRNYAKRYQNIFLSKRFFCGKMLMFANVLIENFIYDLTEIFFFPNEWTKEIYNYYMIDRIFPYSIITDTDSICIFFIFIRKLDSCAPDLVFRDFLFEVVIKKDVLHRFDTSNKFWDKCGVRNEHLKKNARLLFHRNYWQSVLSYCCAQSKWVFWRVWEPICK